MKLIRERMFLLARESRRRYMICAGINFITTPHHHSSSEDNPRFTGTVQNQVSLRVTCRFQNNISVEWFKMI